MRESAPEEKTMPMSDAAPAKTFRWDDPLDLEGRLTDDERMIRDAARS